MSSQEALEISDESVYASMKGAQESLGDGIHEYDQRIKKGNFGISIREEIGILVDFLAEIFQEEGHLLIGIRGMPRVGKTESIVAGSVTAKKKWLFLSSTLIKQTERTSLLKGEYEPEQRLHHREDENQEITYEKHRKQHWFEDEDMNFFGGM